MALADVASNLTEPDGLPWRTCGTCHALAGMTDTDAATLRKLLADRNVKFVDLAKALADDPDSPSIEHHALSRHARGLCSAREVLR
jgi:hypothetical protein